jgi:tetratricopeptide (TPR) repeat protein
MGPYKEDLVSTLDALFYYMEFTLKSFRIKNFFLFTCQIVFLFSFADIGTAETVKLSHQNVDANRLRILIQWPESIPSFEAEVESNELISIDLKEVKSPQRLEESFSVPGNTLQGNNLLLLFAEPIQAPSIESFAKEIPSWIKSIKSGYDSLMIQTSNSAAFQVLKDKNQIIVQIKQSPPNQIKQTDTEDKELLHLESSLLLQANKFDAHSRLTEMLEAYPNDPKIMADLGSVEERLGRWRQAMKHYDCALKLDPGAIDNLQAKSFLHGRSGPQVRVDQYYRDTTNAEVQAVSRIMARQSYCSDYMVGVAYEKRLINDNLVRRRINGTLETFDGNRQRWNSYVEKAYDFSTTRLSIVGQETQPGASLDHRRQLPLGELSLAGIYHEPYWEFVEGLVNQGTADRVRLQWFYEGHSPIIGKYKSKNPFSGSLGVSINRYGVEDEDNVAESVKLMAELRYQINRLWPWLSVGYQYNSEYVNLTETRIDTAGANFNPLPIQSVQTHSWDVSVTKQVNKNLRFDLSSGFKFDGQVDSNGPFVFFDLIYDSLSNIEVGVNAQFNQETARGTNNTFTQFGAFLTWKL